MPHCNAGECWQMHTNRSNYKLHSVQAYCLSLPFHPAHRRLPLVPPSLPAKRPQAPQSTPARPPPSRCADVSAVAGDTP